MRTVTVEDGEVVQRLADAGAHDELLIMINDPDSGRPLIRLSVTKEGHGIIEADDGDLAPGIRQLNRVLSDALQSRDGRRIS